ncbi:MAG: hypothetical protein KY461_12875 [Actinobacteria bacterium]|nr:hypothetical protein [Actinomycetota bacterium]
MRRRSAATARVTGCLLAALTALLLTAPAALAQAAGTTGGLSAEDLGLEVQVGYGGRVVPGRWIPVEVTLAPSRLFAGDVGVVVETGMGRMVETREVEVAAGSTKIFRFLAPPAHSVRVQVAATGEDEGLNVTPALDRSDSFLVGVLGADVPAEARPIASQPLDQRGTVVPVDPAFLQRSSRALDPLSALVVSPEVLAGLDDRTRDRLQAAVATGIDLVVIATTDGTLELDLPWVSATGATTAQLVRERTGDGEPDRQGGRVLDPGPLAWSLSSADLGWSDDDRPIATAVNAGKGRVIVTGLPLGEGPLGGDDAFWGRLLQPNAPLGSNGGGESQRFEQIAQVAGEGLRSDDVALPGITLIALALLLYLVLVGPVNGFVLARMGRRELAWLTIPALTVVFTGAAFVASAGAESASGLSGRAAYWIDGHGTQLQAAALRAPRAGDHRLVFDGDDWDLAPAMWSEVPALVERGGGETVMRIALEALQVGTATAYRDLSTPPPLSLDLDPIPAGARVTVTNTTTGTIEDVRVRAGTLVARHGSLAGGETAVLELDRDVLPVQQDWHDPFAGLRAGDGTVSAPRSLEALLRWSTVDGNPGVVWATGTAEDDVGLGAPSADGSPTDDRGSFVAVGVTAGIPGTDTLPWEVDRRLLTTGFGEAWRPGPLAVEGRIEAVLRFRLPNEGPVGRLVPSLDRGQLQGMFEGDMAPPMEEVCRTVEERDEDGNLVGTVEECVVEGMEGVEQVAPAIPECPPDAVSCDIGETEWEFCFEDGTCQGGGFEPGMPMPMPEPFPGNVPGGDVGLQIYNHVVPGWEEVADAFAADETDTTVFVSPLGEVFVRAVGELHPFDFSGRGIGAVRGAA